MDYNQDNVAFTIVVTFDGEVQVRSANGELAPDRGFPPEGKIREITNVTQLAVINFEGSPGCVLVYGAGGAYWDCK